MIYRDREKNSDIINKLDKTAENVPILWLPCIIILAAVSFISFVFGKISPRKHNDEGCRKPLWKRAVALAAVFAFTGAFIPEAADISFAIKAYAADEVGSGTCGENADWTLDSDGVLRITGTGAMFDYDSAYDTPWTNEDVFSAVIDNGITSIGRYAFGKCTKLVSVSIPESVRNIGENAFSGCTEITSVTLPDSIGSIGDNAFSGCSGLVSVVLPSSIAQINDFTFYKCTSLNNVVIPDSCKKIGRSAFSGCTSLKKMKVPPSVTYIFADSFTGCTDLVFYGKRGSYAENYASEHDNITFEAEPYTITIPENVTVTRGDEVLSSGDDIYSGDVLVITAADREGYIYTLTVNGSDFTSSESYTVAYEDVYITISYEEDPNNIYTITIPEHITVTRGADTLSSGDRIYPGDNIIIKADELEGYELDYIKMNEQKVSDGGQFTLGKGNVVIEVSYKEKQKIGYKVTFPGYITVKCNGDVISSGTVVYEGDKLRITADDIVSGKRLVSVSVNGRVITNGSEYIVSDSNVSISALYENVYKVTFPAEVKVSRDNKTISSGSSVYSGDKLLITAEESMPGKRLKALYVNGREIKSGDIYIVNDYDVTITAEYEEVKYKVTFPQEVDVVIGKTFLVSGDSVPTGSRLVISAKTVSGKRLVSLKVNGQDITNGSTYTVTDQDVVITADYESFDKNSFVLTYPDHVRVTCGGEVIPSGSIVHKGDVLKISAEALEGKKLISLKVNGSEIKSGSTYTVTDRDVDITVEYSGSDDEPDPYYTVTFPDHVTVTVNEKETTSGSRIYPGDELKIIADYIPGKTLVSLTLNGEEIYSGSTYIVKDSSVIIDAVYSTDPDTGYTLYCTKYVTVYRSGKIITSGSSIYSGDVLTICADKIPGYHLVSLKVNGEKFPDGGSMLVEESDVTVTADYAKDSEETYHTITFPSYVDVSCNGRSIVSGSRIKAGDVLIITAMEKLRGYILSSLTLNGREISNGFVYIAGEEDLIIEARYKYIGEEDKETPSDPSDISDRIPRPYHEQNPGFDFDDEEESPYDDKPPYDDGIFDDGLIHDDDNEQPENDEQIYDDDEQPENIEAGAGMTETAMPESTGGTRLPSALMKSRKGAPARKRRYRILRKRNLRDSVFVL